ncbi:cysteine hydrolase family protein [Chitinimonas sp. PSY-7]|uniref:isochorismatase family protein n=1 Tax=Chitinimonas sp. PSY-7 TaxID=3459088 RepID=UPI0040400B41
MYQAGSKRSALLIVDMQVGLFNGQDRPYEGQRVLDNINQLIRQARNAGVPIFAARHTGPQGSPIAPESPLSQLLSELEVDDVVDTVFDKTKPSCFLGTGLADRLASAGISEIVICGMKTQYCIDTTCRIAAELGFQPVLVADAHTCMDTQVLSAKAIIDHHNMTLNGPFVTLLNTSDVRF